MESTTTAPAAAPATPAAAPAVTGTTPVPSTPALSAPAATGTNAQTQITGTEQPQPGAAKPQQSESFFGGSTMIFLLVGIWVLFFFSWRSGKRKEREAREQRDKELNAIVKGDKVVTIGRVHGTVVKADEKTFTIKPDPARDYTMTFDREALLRIIKKDGEASESVGDLTQTNDQQ